MSGPGSSGTPDKATRELLQVFGANLRSARERRGLTQSQLEEASGSARTYISRVESGEANLLLATAVRLAHAVGSTVEQMIQPPGEGQRSAHAATVSGILPPEDGMLAIELPAGQAFEVGLAASRQIGQAIPLIDTRTREVKGVIPKP